MCEQESVCRKDCWLYFPCGSEGKSCNLQWIIWEGRTFQVWEIHYMHPIWSHWRLEQRRGCSAISFGCDSFMVSLILWWSEIIELPPVKNIFSPFTWKSLEHVELLRITPKRNMEKKNQILRTWWCVIRKWKKENETAHCVYSYGFTLANPTVDFLCSHICCDACEVWFLF